MNTHHSEMKTIGIWVSEKKSQKLNWDEFHKACSMFGFRLLKMNVNENMEEQGRIDVFIHKLTDVIAAADQGDLECKTIITNVENYLARHKDILVIDPLDKVRVLLDRSHYYAVLRDEFKYERNGIFIPSYAVLEANETDINLQVMDLNDVQFPIVCKPTVGHGSKSAHQMILVFNQKGLPVCRPPCIVQNFINHDALLHKVYVVGNRYHICQRPSIKNFFDSDNLNPIYYTASDVCKANSQSALSVLDANDVITHRLPLQQEKVREIIQVLRRRIGMMLIGFDVVVDNVTGYHAIIDINVFPSYDSYPKFFENLLISIPNHTVQSYSVNDEASSSSIINVGGMA